MANGKTLRFACGYKSDCNGNDLHISCIYNLMGGYPHSVLYETGKMCTKNKDCTTYERSTCDPISHLCVFSGTPPPPAEADAIDYANSCELKKSAEKDRKGFGENVYVYPAPNADPVEAFEAVS
ncbi:hypothetical protein ANCDUO_17062 [Ancylostoma duodenale]|uniref:SCP domain-containing protein n=1 Tax=Ancylostoma duodenale TaxID=51022 RepID=A0A0C2C964_9BILA|nr:hypothetical protein ANCDUO_17062 [Ancylostoma duodenale]